MKNIFEAKNKKKNNEFIGNRILSFSFFITHIPNQPQLSKAFHGRRDYFNLSSGRKHAGLHFLCLSKFNSHLPIDDSDTDMGSPLGTIK
jgi:hypothetical protein